MRYNGFENSNPNIIIENHISNSEYALRSSGDFGDEFGGLTFLCNIFKSVTNSNIFRFGDVNNQKGTLDAASGNDFTHNGVENGDFFTRNDLGNLLNYYYKNISNQEPIDYNKINPVFTDNDANCSLTSPNGENTPLPQERLDDLINLLDNGNTNTLIDLINNNSITNPTLVLTTLTNLSPYVSIEVITTLLANSDSYLEEEVANIIALNPAVIQDNYIADAVFYSNSFSSLSQTLIENAYYNGDSRIDLENDINFASQLTGEEILNNITSAHNTLPIDWIYIRTQLEKGVTEMYKFQILETYLEENNWTGANSYITDLSNLNIIDPIQQAEFEKYIDIANIQVKYGEINESLNNININDKQILLDIANNYFGIATKKARLILQHNFDMSFGDFPIRPGYSPIIFRSLPRSVRGIIGNIQVYPNPTDDVLNISLDYEGLKEREIQLELFDAKGLKLKSIVINGVDTTINLSSYQSGICNTSRS